MITSAGTAAGIDACLHIVRKEQGPEVANKIARRMVVPPHRDGGQAQYIERPLPRSQCDTVGEVLVWMERHLDEEVTVEQLAERAHMSPRTFARRFQQETGTTPYRWILRQRVLLAQRLLEATDETVDAIAGRAGFGTAAALRHQFLRAVGTTPNAYRRTFQGPGGGRLTYVLGTGFSSSPAGFSVMPTRGASSDPGTCSKRYFRATAAVISVSWAIEKWSLGHFRLPVLKGLMACFGTALARSGRQRGDRTPGCRRTTSDRAGSHTGCRRCRPRPECDSHRVPCPRTARRVNIHTAGRKRMTSITRLFVCVSSRTSLNATGRPPVTDSTSAHTLSACSGCSARAWSNHMTVAATVSLPGVTIATTWSWTSCSPMGSPFSSFASSNAVSKSSGF